MSKAAPTPITDAIGVVNLTGTHLENPTAVPAHVVRYASAERIQRLEAISPDAIHLVALYTALLAITPLGWLPHVTPTNDLARPFGAVITDAAGNVVAWDKGKTVNSLVTQLQLRLPAGCGEAWA